MVSTVKCELGGVRRRRKDGGPTQRQARRALIALGSASTSEVMEWTRRRSNRRWHHRSARRALESVGAVRVGRVPVRQPLQVRYLRRELRNGAGMTDAQIDAVAGLIFKFRICGSNRNGYPCEFCDWSPDPMNPDPFGIGCRWLARQILEAVETVGAK
jgi:hypothetical protein